jgi:16S rRNA (guanine(966)-N(2))-methyltransferase RsmD
MAADTKRTRNPKKQRAANAAMLAGAAPARSVSTHPTRAGDKAGAGRVRIVGGMWKRTPIAVADLPGLRPTPDRVRETVFNWLTFLRPDIEAVHGLDLFAGTGALGFELASRGAARVVLVEQRADLVARLQALKARLDATQVEVVQGDALRVAASLPAGAFDVIFLDPPFGGGLLQPALERMRTLLAAGGLAYVESAEPVAPETARALGLELVRAGNAGRVRFHLLRKDGS